MISRKTLDSCKIRLLFEQKREDLGDVTVLPKYCRCKAELEGGNQKLRINRAIPSQHQSFQTRVNFFSFYM